MFAVLWNLLCFAVALGILVIVHEAGHFLQPGHVKSKFSVSPSVLERCFFPEPVRTVASILCLPFLLVVMSRCLAKMIPQTAMLKDRF